MNDQLRVYRNKVTEWYVAATPDDAATLMRAYHLDVLGCCPEECEAEGDTDFVREPDDKALSIRWDEATNRADDGDHKLTLTCAEWAQKVGRGFLATTEW